MSCLACARHLHDECEHSSPCCCATETASTLSPVETPSPIEKNVRKTRSTGKKKRGRPVQVEIKTSAGRKRAAKIHKVDREAPCEWQQKKNCGGGLYPIVGCVAGKQKHVHHGPIKDTARNEAGNAHKICTSCHNRWHAKNDSVYDEKKYELLPHKPSPATIDEIMIAEAEWVK